VGPELFDIQDGFVLLEQKYLLKQFKKASPAAGNREIINVILRYQLRLYAEMPVRGGKMLSSVNSLNIQPVHNNVKHAAEKIMSAEPHALIDDRSIKGILFLGVKGDISSIVGSKSKVDILA